MESETEDRKLRAILRNNFGMDFPVSRGSGNSRDNPIIIHKVKPNDFIAVEYGILNCLGIGRGIEWEVLQ